METLIIEILNPKAKNLINDLADMQLITVQNTVNNWNNLWYKMDKLLPQKEANISEDEVMHEIKLSRLERAKNK